LVERKDVAAPPHLSQLLEDLLHPFDLFDYQIAFLPFLHPPIIVIRATV
jgi:hypothetical protein